MHEFKSGISHTIPGRDRMDLSDVTLAEILKSAGYTTGLFGKWHLGLEGPYRQENRGFDVALTSKIRYDYKKGQWALYDISSDLAQEHNIAAYH